MRAPKKARGDWVRIGVGTDWAMALVALAISLFFGYGIPSGTWVGVFAGLGLHAQDSVLAFWTSFAAFLVIAPMLVFLTTRRARVDINRRLLRIGWRTVPFDQLKYVYRTPGGRSGSQFMIRLEVAFGLDARLGINATNQPNLNTNELAALLALLEHAPITPKPGVMLRAPIDDELGPRDESDVLVDQIHRAMMPYGRQAYAKPTVIREVQQQLDAARGAGSNSTGIDDDESSFGRVASALEVNLRGANGYSAGNGMPLPDEVEKRAHGRFSRGLLGTVSLSYRRQNKVVTTWLMSRDALAKTEWSRLRISAWVVIAVCVAVPVLLPRGITDFLAPVGVWVAILMLYRDRIRRYCSKRAAVLRVRRSGINVPKKVREFFGERFPERAVARHIFYSRIFIGVVFLFVVLFLSVGDFPLFEHWYERQEWQRPVAAFVLVLVITNFVAAVRVASNGFADVVRARLEYVAISHKLPVKKP